MRCILVGNYGVGNVGDEALREYMLSRFPHVEWIVLSAHPTTEELPRLPAGIRSFFGTPWWQTVDAIRRADAVVFGGGSLFTDVESSFACMLWWIHAAVARFLRKPILLAFQGIGPFNTVRGEWLARWVVERSRFVSVRDRESLERIASWKMNRKSIQSADPIFLSEPKSKEKRTQDVIGIVPRRNPTSAFFEGVKRVVSEHLSAEIHLVSLQPDDPAEQETIRTLQTLIVRSAVVVPIRTYTELLHATAGTKLVFTQRYHGAIAALSCGVDVEICPQGEGDKLWALKERIARVGAEMTLQEERERALAGERALREEFASLSSFQ